MDRAFSAPSLTYPSVFPLEGVGRHLLLFYQRVDDALPSLATFLADGLRRGDRCLYITEEPSQAKERLRGMGLPVEQVEFQSLSAWYAPRGSLDEEGTRGRWIQYLEEARAQGFAAVTAVGDVGSYFARSGELEAFVGYEERAHDLLCQSNVRAVCAYDWGGLPEPFFSRLVGCHQALAQVVTGEVGLPDERLPRSEAGIARGPSRCLWGHGCELCQSG